MVSPAKSGFPVSISKQATPNAQMSARVSTRRPVACSGAMYAAVPMIVPTWVARAVSVGEVIAFALDAPPGSIAFANPKSSTFTVPSGRTLMFAGFRSRWMIPCSCAASSASAICFAIGQRVGERDRPIRDAVRQGRPLDELHDQRESSLGLFQAVDVRDVPIV